MQTEANLIIDALGGTTAVSRLTDTPLSTVHSWRKNGIPRSRLAHLRLAAKAAGKSLPAAGTCNACTRASAGDVAACTATACPLRQVELEAEAA